MDTRQIDAILDLLTEDELDATLRWIDHLSSSVPPCGSVDASQFRESTRLR